MQHYILSDLLSRAAFQDYWRDNIQGQKLTDILGLPFMPSLSLPLYSDLILRTAATDLSIVVDTAGARVKVGTRAVEDGQEVKPHAFVYKDLYVPTIEEIRSRGPAHFKLPTEGWEALNWIPRRLWERIEPNMLGQAFRDIILFDTTIDWGYTYCHKVSIDFEAARLVLEDLQDEMHIETYPRSYTTGW